MSKIYLNSIFQNVVQYFRGDSATLDHTGPYVYIVKVMYDFASLLLISPVHLVYKVDKKEFQLRPRHPLQRGGCILIQILASLSAIKMLSGMWSHLLCNKGYIVAYFDFMNGLFLHGYLYTLVYFHWFQSDRIQSFIQNLQTSPLKGFSSFATWKGVGFAGFLWCLTLYMAYIWLLIVYSFDPLRWRVTSGTMARDIFWLGVNTPVPDILAFAAMIARFYNGLLIHLPHNVFGPLYLYCVHFVARDFFDTGLKKQMSVRKTLELYSEYGTFLKCGNNILSPFCIHFVGMTMSYHSLHLFDALSVEEGLWKINTNLYIIYLVNFLALPAKTLLLNKKLKAWLWTNKNWACLSKSELSLVLYDLSHETSRLAIRGGKLFTLSARFSGLIVQYLCSYSMLNTVAQRRHVQD